MSNTNITRAEAAERATDISVSSYVVDLDLTTGPDTFRSHTTVRFDSSVAETWVDLIASLVLSIELNGTPLDPAEVVHGSRIQLRQLQAVNELRVVADCAYTNTGEGLHRFVDPVDDEVYLYTQFETADARQVYACFEQPDLKGTFQLAVTAPSHWQVRSNSPTPDPTLGADGVSRWEFEPTPPLSTYVTALVAGPYHCVLDAHEGRGATIPLGVFCRASLAEHLDPDEILTVTKQGFEFFEDAFGRPYPFPKYDQIFVPEFNAGAMENAGCVTFLEDYVFRSRVTRAAYEQRANTILHEMAHMWFGDLVTMRWWDDLWLNESFAEWASHHASVEATQYTDAWTTFAIQRKAWAYRQDQLPSTHPIAADMVDLDAVRVNFDGITYAKGASALKQLVAWVGEDEFLTGVRSYFQDFAWGNTQLPDLLGHLSAASGRELADWTKQWLQTSGVNLLRAEIVPDPDDSNRMATVTVVQEPPSTPPGLPPTLRNHRLGIGLYERVEGALVRTRLVEADITGPRTVVDELAGEHRPALLLLNDQDLTFAKIRLDELSAATVISSIGTIQDSLARTLVWGAAWDMTRDAEMSTGDYVRLAISGLGGEPDVAVVQTTLRQVQAAVEQYAAPSNRDTYEKRLAENLWIWTRQAEPGSDHQLAFVRALAAFATGDQLDTIADLLSGRRALAGLTVDTDLRWTLLGSLARAGRVDEEQIEAEARRDDTATGHRRRAGVLASRPTESAKEAAWRDIMDRPELPNAILESTLGGFAQAGQEELLSPYVERYFDRIKGIWLERSPEMAQSITMLLYPRLAVTPETIDKAEVLLRAGDLPHSAARLVREGADGTRRALKARRLDAESGGGTSAAPLSG